MNQQLENELNRLLLAEIVSQGFSEIQKAADEVRMNGCDFVTLSGSMVTTANNLIKELSHANH